MGTISYYNCTACYEDHESLDVHPFSDSTREANDSNLWWWAVCPETKRTVLIGHSALEKWPPDEMEIEVELESFEKPSVDQVAWVFEKLTKALEEGGTFSYLIYNLMGFYKTHYLKLFEAGGMGVVNALHAASSRVTKGIKE